MQESPKKSILLFREKTKPSSKVKTIPNERRAKEIENNNLGFDKITKHLLYDFFLAYQTRSLEIGRRIGVSIFVSSFIYCRL